MLICTGRSGMVVLDVQPVRLLLAVKVMVAGGSVVQVRGCGYCRRTEE